MEPAAFSLVWRPACCSASHACYECVMVDCDVIAVRAVAEQVPHRVLARNNFGLGENILGT